ncbi:MAG: hypothetical protein FWD68_17085, partial [Alphaproteobacteria bacterium]|nr:hypothetical protein [Alphaproteobacteria bacterium]
SPTSVCSFAGDELDELIPCGVVDGLREHSGRESLHVQIFESNMRKTIRQGPGQFVRKVAALAGSGRKAVGCACAVCRAPGAIGGCGVEGVALARNESSLLSRPIKPGQVCCAPAQEVRGETGAIRKPREEF